MEQSRLIHSILGAITSMAATAWTFIQVNSWFISLTIAVVAGCYSIQAARETIKTRRAERKRMEDYDSTL